MGRASPRQITCCCCSPSSLPPPRLPSGWSTPSSPRTASCPTRCTTHLVVTCLHRADSSPPPRPAPWTRAPSAGQAGQLRARRREPRGLTSSPPMPPSSIYLVGDGIAVSKEYKIYVLATCTTAVSDAAKLATVTSPFFMINGFHVSGISTSFIAKGTVTGKTEVSGMYIAVYNDADTLIGCTNAAMS